MNIFEKLMNVQAEVVATKNEYNSFGKYHYRSCESILEAAKPILQKNKSTILLFDELVQLGDRYYIRATAQFVDCESENKVNVSAFAREDEVKKGMDGAQITGAASSYARKYALSGLLLLDDNKDPDMTNKHGKSGAAGKDDAPPLERPFPEAEGLQSKVGDSDVQMLKSILAVYPKAQQDAYLSSACAKYGVKSMKDFTKSQYVKFREELLKNADAVMKKRLEKIISDFAKKTNTDVKDARQFIESGIGKSIDDINIAEFPMYRDKIQVMYKNLGAGNEATGI